MKRFNLAVIAIAILGLVVLPGLGCKGGSKAAKNSLKPVSLTYWRVFDGSDAFASIIEDYRKIHPNVTIDYRKLRFDEYEDEILRAFAEDRGPDMFSVHNTWMKEYKPLIKPLPDTVRLTYSEQKGTIKKESVVVVRDEPTMTTRTLDDTFVQVVKDYAIYPASEDGSTKNRIHSIPLSVDTLALFYNKDILDAAGIPQPPRTWEEFQEDVVSLTKYDVNGNVAQSGAAIGAGGNIERSSDIISLLMMQSGAELADTRGQARFAEQVIIDGQRIIPSTSALRFYTDFANPTKESYTWSQDFANSFDAFASGQTGFFFGYSYHKPLLDARSSKLNYAVSPVPQINEDLSSSINYANFWMETVSKQSDNADWAWDFIQFAAKERNVQSYLNRTDKPTALRGLVLDQSNNSDVGVFADQVLSARAWYNGQDATAAEQALADMIDAVVDGSLALQDALDVAQQQVNQTL